MARSPATASVKTDAADAVSEQVTYTPGPGDNATTRWHGYSFNANVPKTVRNPLLIEQAKVNPFFHVGPFDPQRDSSPDVPVTTTKTSMQYRAHVMAWLKKGENAEDVIRYWVADSALRDACEVGTDDYDYLGPFIERKLFELAKRDSHTDSQVSEIWRRYGVIQLPWARYAGVAMATRE